MEINNSATGGRLQISSDVIAKIARLATMEIDGVIDVSVGGNPATKNILEKIAPQKPIVVEVNDEVADIEVNITARYGAKIPDLSEKIQKNVKSSVQNMTSITVAKVNVVVTGVVQE